MHTKSSAEDIATIRRQAWGQLFGGGIEAARKAAGLSIEQFAGAGGLAIGFCMAVEAGHVPDDWEQLRAIADAINVPHDQMALYAFMCREAWSL
jgi:transcriptional regulator with XRE-family HTH domain